MSEPFAIGVLEDDATMRDYLRATIDGVPDFALAFCEPTLKAARAGATAHGRVDLALVDLQLPDGNGTEFVRWIDSHFGARALILTVLGDRTSVLSAFRSGAHGYLLKDAAPDQIVRNIRETLAGAHPISAQVSTHLLSAMRDTAERSSVSPLSERETQVLTLFAKGLSYKESAEALSVSSHTVNHYVKSIYGKLDVNSRNEAVFEALQQGWIAI